MKQTLSMFPSPALDLMEVDLQQLCTLLSDLSPFKTSTPERLEDDLLNVLGTCTYRLRKKYSEEDYLLALTGHEFFVPLFTRLYSHETVREEEFATILDETITILQHKYKIENPFHMYVAEGDEQTKVSEIPNLIEMPEFTHSNSLHHRVEKEADHAVNELAHKQDLETIYAALALGVIIPPAFGVPSQLEKYVQLRDKYGIKQEFVFEEPKPEL